MTYLESLLLQIKGMTSFGVISSGSDRARGGRHSTLGNTEVQYLKTLIAKLRKTLIGLVWDQPG